LTRGKEGKEEKGGRGFSFLSFPSFLFPPSIPPVHGGMPPAAAMYPPLPQKGGDYFLKHAALFQEKKEDSTR